MNANLIVKLTQYILHATIGSDDLADNLNNRFTGVIMVFFVGILFIKQYVFKPIQCWVPQEFSKSWEEYAEYYCWVADTYFVPLQHQLNTVQAEKNTRRLTYYQWVPFCLLVQCGVFYVPYICWHLFSKRSGMNIHGLIKCASNASVAEPEQREKIVVYVARYLDECLYHNREQSPGPMFRLWKCLSQYFPCLIFGKRLGNYLVALYIFVKLMHIGNLIGQIYLIGVFTGTNYTFYGLQLLEDMMRGRHWEQSGLFPRVTWCDFQVWTVGNLVRFSVQCVLPINLFNEKIYIFLWFWFVFVLAVTIASLINWLLKLVIAKRRRRFIYKFLKLMDRVNRGDKKLANRFIDNVLRYDGVFVLHVLAEKTGEILVGEVVCQMWSWYKDKMNASPSQIGIASSGRGPFRHHDHSHRRQIPVANLARCHHDKRDGKVGFM